MTIAGLVNDRRTLLGRPPIDEDNPSLIGAEYLELLIDQAGLRSIRREYVPKIPRPTGILFDDAEPGTFWVADVAAAYASITWSVGFDVRVGKRGAGRRGVLLPRGVLGEAWMRDKSVRNATVGLTAMTEPWRRWSNPDLRYLCTLVMELMAHLAGRNGAVAWLTDAAIFVNESDATEFVELARTLGVVMRVEQAEVTALPSLRAEPSYKLARRAMETLPELNLSDGQRVARGEA